MGRKKKGDMSPKKVRVSYTIDPDLIGKMALVAENHSQSVSSVFEEAVTYFLELVKQQEEIEQKEFEEHRDLEKQAEFVAPKRLLRRRPDDGSATPHEIQTG